MPSLLNSIELKEGTNTVLLKLFSKFEIDILKVENGEYDHRGPQAHQSS